MNNRIPLVTVASIALFACSAPADIGDQTLKLLPADGTSEAAFGGSVDLSGGIVVAGSPGDDDHGTDSGSAYLFDATTGAQLMKLLPDDGAAGGQFGVSVAIAENIVVVGAIGDDDNGLNSGSVYLFDAGTGAQLAKLLPDDGAAGDAFGIAVAIDNGIVVVGSKRDDHNGMDSGSVYIFDAISGAQLDKLTPDDAAANDNFGGAVALDGGVIAVGAHAKWNGPLFLAGAAYLFDAATGDQLQKLLPDDAAANNFFGAAIDIDDGVVVVGAWAKSIVYDHSGAAYLFDVSTGAQLVPRLVPADSADRDNFGRSVAIQNGIVAVSAPGDSDDGLFEAGSAYLYSVPDGAELMELYADDRDALDNLGSGIALDNGLLVVGVGRDDDNGPQSGSAYVFRVNDDTCPADLDGNGMVGFNDLVALLAAWGACNECPEDIDGDGAVAFGDLVVMLSAWGPC